MIFVDTNILVDVLQDDAIWGDWSRERLITATADGDIGINDVVFAELAVGYASLQAVNEVLATLGVIRVPAPPIALFVAGKAYQRYRATGGTRTSVLPDFFIGAQALLAGAELITRDVRRYRTYFPDLPLIAPIPN